MKINKTLLQAILVGVTVGTTTSCGLFDQIDEDTQPQQEVVHEGEEDEEGKCWINCMACGMG